MARLLDTRFPSERPRHVFRLGGLGPIAKGLLVLLISVRMTSAAEPKVDFGRQILPLLSDNCFSCHGPDEKSRKADLSLHTEAGVLERPTPIVTAGDSRTSVLMQRISSSDPDLLMPPPGSARKLESHQIELLRRWIDQGAKWGKHWAFEKPIRPAVPSGENAIDFFVEARLKEEQLLGTPPAARETLIRRVTFDLTGLPPTLEEVDAFLTDTDSNAYEKVVDRLLATPRYGQRMAWDWLDAARYADTNGFQGDPERTMWPWRDWVVDAFNANMPYDQFTIEQLAGDLLPSATFEQQLASGFNRNNMHNGEGGRIAEETRVENVFDRVETTATIWLGVTFTCCRCHDHKFDPFTLRDYYGLYDIFNQMSETGQGRGGQAPPVLNFSTDQEKKRLDEAESQHAASAKEVEAFELKKFPRGDDGLLPEETVNKFPGNLQDAFIKTKPQDRRLAPLLEAVSHFEADESQKEYAGLLKKLLNGLRERDDAAASVTKVMIMDQLPTPRETFILSRGTYDKPTDVRVEASLPASLLSNSTKDSPPGLQGSSSQRLTRLDLARWLVSTENPLSARVTVNRFWQIFFGTGLVKTSEDFGVQGEKPTHPELLDWLAVEFVEGGWNVKALCKRIVMSSTYRRASIVAPELLERDPDNRLLARGPRYRLPSWMMRDAALAVGGLLVDKPGGPSVRPYQPDGIWEEATFGKKTYKQDHGDALYRRTLYVFWRRIVGPTMLFDTAARQTCTVKNSRTNTPLHALTTLNDTAYVEAARGMAQRILRLAADDPTRLEIAFRLATSRQPTEEESTILLRRLALLKEQFSGQRDEAIKLLKVGESPRDETLDPVEHAAFTGVCSLVLNLDEAISKE